MTSENAQDIDQVCSVVSEMGGSYSNYYNKYKSGTWNSSESSSSGGRVMGDVEKSSIAIGFLSFFLLGAVAGGVWLYKKQQEKLANSTREPLNCDTFDSIQTQGVMT
mmetsp:Transcript_2635/g.4489  ORF Transcript_2635/g.4489 Transcript_2635/m.4489 type:complete len:107 (-) Transcript_2635:44-364(-)